MITMFSKTANYTAQRRIDIDLTTELTELLKNYDMSLVPNGGWYNVYDWDTSRVVGMFFPVPVSWNSEEQALTFQTQDGNGRNDEYLTAQELCTRFFDDAMFFRRKKVLAMS